MRSWFLVAGAVGLFSYAGVSYALKREPAAPPPPPAADAPAGAAPVVLEQVVDVADLDALLEPRAPGADAGAPFEQIEFPASAPPEVAPAPRSVETPPDPQGAAEVVDPARAAWYGAHRFPRQIAARRAPAAGDWAGREWEFYRPAGVTTGFGLYF